MIAVLLALLAGSARAEPEGTVRSASEGASITLDLVFERVDSHLPLLEAADARLREADGKVLAKRGAFDPTLYGKGSAYGGKDPRTAVDVGVKAATLWGPTVSTGWARGVGEFPPYDLNAETGPSGEVYARLDVPVLDGFGYGEKRAALALAQQERLGKQAARDDAARKARLEAAKRYWAWMAAAWVLQIAEDQLQLAERRGQALKRQVETGNKPEMDLLDNERVLNERLAKRADARRKLELAALSLSLYLRDDDGNPWVPTRAQVPAEWPGARPIPEVGELGDVAWRPDRAKLEAELRGAAIDQRRARNGLLPEVNVSATGIQPLDADRKQEVIGGVTVAAPLAFRDAVGTKRAADAGASALAAELRMLDDGIRAEIAGAFETRRQAGDRAEAARIAAERAQDVLRLERRRFELGGSDLFQLLQREDALAKAREASVDAEYALHVSDAVLEAVLARSSAIREER